MSCCCALVSTPVLNRLRPTRRYQTTPLTMIAVYLIAMRSPIDRFPRPEIKRTLPLTSLALAPLDGNWEFLVRPARWALLDDLDYTTARQSAHNKYCDDWRNRNEHTEQRTHDYGVRSRSRRRISPRSCRLR